MPTENHNPVFFHVGLTKAASTTLQFFFESHDSLIFIDRYATIQKLSSRTSLEYSEDEAGKFLEEEIARVSEAGKTPIFSHERLTGNPHSGHYDVQEIAGRIHALLPQAKIIICLREQLSILASCYKQYIAIGGTKSVEEYLLPSWEWRVPLFNWRFYEYHRLIGHYLGLFGADNVLVLLVEELAENPQHFYTRLCDFMKIPVSENFYTRTLRNPGLTDRQTARERFRNIFRTNIISIRDPSPFRELPVTNLVSKMVGGLENAIRFSDDEDISGQVTRLFSGRFTESNRTTSKLIEMDLVGHGYES